MKNVDWEAIGLDHRTGTDRLVIGESGTTARIATGSPGRRPPSTCCPSPRLSATQSPVVTAALPGAARYPFRYYDDAGSNVWKPRDAESLFVDPRTHNVFILWKHLATGKRSRVFELPDQDLADGTD